MIYTQLQAIIASSLYKLFCIFMTFLFMTKAFAGNEFLDDRNRGWFWFEEEQVEAEQEESKQKQSRKVTASEELKQFQKELEESKAAMIMRPSVENARLYIQRQNRMFALSDVVGKNWQLAMLIYPELNIAKDIPISDAGASIRKKTEDRKEVELLKQFAKNFQLLFFYKKSCQYCIAFVDVLEAFSLKYGYKVASVTLDGGKIDKFPASNNPGLAQKLNVQSTPTLFAYSEKLGIVTPVAHGFLSIDLLEKNVAFVAAQLRGRL